MNELVGKITMTRIAESAHASFYAPTGTTQQYEAGVVHEQRQLADGGVLGGMRFGGMYEIIDSPLTRAQTRVLALRTLGLTVREVADALYVGEVTILTHQKHLTRELGVVSMGGAVVTAFNGHSPFFVPYKYGQAEVCLTFSEKRVLGHLADGASTNEVAALLYVGPETVKTHVYNILAKTQIPGDRRISLVAFAHLTDVLHGEPAA